MWDFHLGQAAGTEMQAGPLPELLIGRSESDKFGRKRLKEY